MKPARLKTGENYLLTPRPAFDTGPAMFGEPQKPILLHPRSVQKWATQKSNVLSVITQQKEVGVNRKSRFPR